MKQKKQKTELNALNVGKLGVEASMQRDCLEQTIEEYKLFFISKHAKKPLTQPISLAKLQLWQAEINDLRSLIGLSYIRNYQELVAWIKQTKKTIKRLQK